MKKDWEIIRAILLELESSPTANAVLNANSLPPYDEQQVAYNIRLLNQAGYIVANTRDSSSGDGKIVIALARSLTNSGHELLDTIRSDRVWSKVQDKFKSSGLDMTFELVILAGKKIMEVMIS